jgi:hypothetical protein
MQSGERLRRFGKRSAFREAEKLCSSFEIMVPVESGWQFLVRFRLTKTPHAQAGDTFRDRGQKNAAERSLCNR